jgi:hypothetical protein
METSGELRFDASDTARGTGGGWLWEENSWSIMAIRGRLSWAVRSESYGVWGFCSTGQINLF